MQANRVEASHGAWARLLIAVLAALMLFSFASPTGIATVFAADPEPTAEPKPSGEAEPQLKPAEQRIENVIAAARQYLGFPYLLGTEGPALFDCSGLMFRIFSDASLVDRISGNRLRAAGYMRWFARQGLMTANEEEAQRGDLVIYNGGKHIGIYLGDGRTISALLTGVAVHGLHGISQEVTGFLRPDWSGEGEVPPFVPLDLPDVIEEPAVLVPDNDWLPVIDEETLEPIEREGKERPDLRTPTTRTFENKDGTFTTEFHSQPIHYLPLDDDEDANADADAHLQPIDLTFVMNDRKGVAAVDTSPVVVTSRAANHEDGFLSAASGEQAVTLRLPRSGDMSETTAVPSIAANGVVVDYFDFQPKGVGLRVLATADGFRTYLVLSRNPDRNRFTFELDAPGLTAVLDEVGDVLLTDEEGAVVGRIPRPMLLDTADDDGLGGGLYSAATELELTATDDDRTLITVVVRPRFLAEAAYPAYLDLALTGFPAAPPAADVASISSRHVDATLGGFSRPEAAGASDVWLGRQPRSRHETQAYIRFNDVRSTLGTVDVASASLEVLPYLQRADDVATLVSRVDGEWSSDTLTWNTAPETGEELGSLLAETGQWASLDVSEYAADVLSREQIDGGLVLHADVEQPGTWKRIYGGEHGPRLVVTWSGIRPSAVVVDAVALDGPVQALPDPTAEDATTTFAWTLPEIAGAQDGYQVQVSRDGFATFDLDTGNVKRKPGRAMELSLPAEALREAGEYQWRVRARTQAMGWTEWSAPQAFSVVVESVDPGVRIMDAAQMVETPAA